MNMNKDFTVGYVIGGLFVLVLFAAAFAGNYFGLKEVIEYGAFYMDGKQYMVIEVAE